MALNRLAHKSAKTGYTVIIYNWRIFSTSTGVLHMYNEYTNITMCPPQDLYISIKFESKQKENLQIMANF